ncbi:MAG: PLP-dependent transferase [Deltaproteobacteria bacterium]|nr:MAG: PLP-dependent transferase [Deltaproteobacteria bacterium]
MKKNVDLSTRCVHAGEMRDAEGSPHTPIYNTTTFGFRSTADLLDVVEGRRPGNLYTRYGLNPTMEIFDIGEIRRLSHSYGALVAVDNTFASPINQQVLALGADIAVHSATKYLGGHSDLTGGALMGPKDLIDPVAPWRKNLGQMMAPEVAGLLSRSLRTLPIRVERQNKTAQSVAEAMRAHPKIARVLYPGLPDFHQHALAKSQMSGFGGMLTLEIKGSGEDATKVIDSLELIIIAPSLGGPESLATQPMTTTHHGLTPEERLKRGITDSMIRFSIGMEAAEDLIEDLNNALENV